MKRITIKDIRDWGPCYDPVEGKSELPEDWSGTALDVLNLDVPITDRFWVVLRKELLPEKELRLFAVWCARQVQHLMKDERSLKALDVSEAYAKGEATKGELFIAVNAAWEAARYAAHSSHAAYAAYDAAYAAYAANTAYAARSAAYDAAYAATHSAYATRNEEREAQLEYLKKVFIEHGVSEE